MAVPPKALAPQKDGVNHAQAVNDYGQQEKVPGGIWATKPIHA
jgi:hypothetical protein